MPGNANRPVVALDIDGTLGDCYCPNTTRQSRKAWKRAYGEIPEGLCVLHKCDNVLCVRLSHLYLGTYKQNTKDMYDRNRHGKEKITKITDEAIERFIAGEPSDKLAEELGVHRSSISWAARNRFGKHVKNGKLYAKNT